MENEQIYDLIDIIHKRKKILVGLFMLIVAANSIFVFFGHNFEIACVIFMTPWLFIAIDKINISYKLEKILVTTHKEEFSKYKQHNKFLKIALNSGEAFISSSFFKNSKPSQEMSHIANSFRTYNRYLLIYLLFSYVVTMVFALI